MGGILPPCGRRDRQFGRGEQGQPPLSRFIPTPGEISQEIERNVLQERRQRAQQVGACVIAAYRAALARTRRHPVIIARPETLRDSDMMYFVKELERHGWKIGYQSLSATHLTVEPLDERWR